MRCRGVSSWLAVSFVALCGNVLADGGANHQTQQNPPIQLGCTGGSVRDISRFFCCSGTLGALVQDGSGQYVLSNNHVLAASNRGVSGDDISHPGYVDANCQVRLVVADLTRFVSLPFGGTGCCDCAIAKIRAGQVSSDILDIGTPCTGIVTSPTLGMAVKKSGRTTGLTNGSITFLNVTVSVRYSKSCGSNGGSTATFTGQIGIGPSNFSGGGDSGSVIFDTSNPEHAVGLLFAGSASTTFANPIGPVLNALGVTMVGSSCFDDPNPPAPPTYTESELETANAAMEQHRARLEKLMQNGMIEGFGIGLAPEGGVGIALFTTDMGAWLQHRLPTLNGNIPVFAVQTGEVHALGGDGE